jgi:Zn-dependent protease with chaperone function
MVILCGLALGLFSALFSLAAWYDWWPRLPPGALHDTDLWAGILGGFFLLYALIRAKPKDAEKGRRGEAENS